MLQAIGGLCSCFLCALFVLCLPLCVLPLFRRVCCPCPLTHYFKSQTQTCLSFYNRWRRVPGCPLPHNVCCNPWRVCAAVGHHYHLWQLRTTHSACVVGHTGCWKSGVTMHMQCCFCTTHTHACTLTHTDTQTHTHKHINTNTHTHSLLPPCYYDKTGC